MTLTRIRTGPRMSAAVAHGSTVYVSGHVSKDRALGVRGQTQEILARIDTALTEAGTDRSHILSAQIWLADISTFDEMNGVWEAWLPAGQAPARATVEAKLASPDYLVEIAVIAARED